MPVSAESSSPHAAALESQRLREPARCQPEPGGQDKCGVEAWLCGFCCRCFGLVFQYLWSVSVYMVTGFFMLSYMILTCYLVKDWKHRTGKPLSPRILRFFSHAHLVQLNIPCDMFCCHGWHIELFKVVFLPNGPNHIYLQKRAMWKWEEKSDLKPMWKPEIPEDIGNCWCFLWGRPSVQVLLRAGRRVGRGWWSTSGPGDSGTTRQKIIGKRQVISCEL